ncbi:MAG TPA: 3-dehydroquinate synthase [Nitrospiraceae bacterium]|nr:3-dehydroquinate synthase [Nitrospiraceae bacterium]
MLKRCGMDLHLQKIAVPFEYPVVFTTEVFASANPSLVSVISRNEPIRRHRLCVVIDRGVASAWPALSADIQRYADVYRDRLDLAGAPIVIEGGEAAKNAPTLVARLHADLNARNMDRHACVVAIGGGALLDMVGYAAAITHRGLRLVRVPTTVLAQNDAGVSVKNGVNAFGKKNFFGTFSPPFAVLNDRRFLETLSPRDRVSGMAEAVKAALIRDARFFDWMVDQAPLLEAGDPETVSFLIRRCAEIHLDHIAGSGDPFEFGCARPLDFGHWAAHKLESLTRYRLRHGEAVAIGVALDTLYSINAGFLERPAGENVLRLLHNLGLVLWDEALAHSELLTGLAEFREHLGGELTVTLLSAIGDGFEAHEIDVDLMRASIAQLHGRAFSATYAPHRP